MFQNSSVRLDILRERAYNLRWAMVEEGVIPLTAADPDFPCAPQIAEAICKYAKDRYFCYGSPQGLPMFKESMAAHFQHKRLVPVSPDLLFPVDSAAFGIYITCKAALNQGDEAIVFDPVDFLFRYSIESVGATAVPFPIPPGNIPVDFALLEKLITKNTKLICLCNPLNPTGKVFTKAELEAFGKLACKHNLLILSDEIWSDIVFEPHTFTSIASLDAEVRNRTVIITGFSKSFGLAGLRIGAVVAPNQQLFSSLMQASLHQSTIHGANTLAQVAATAALNECEVWLQDFMRHLTHMRAMLVSELNSIPGFSCMAPQGCYVAFVNIRNTGKTSEEMHQFLLKEAKVAVVPGLEKWFGAGAEGYIRLSFASSEAILADALNRIKKVMI